LQRHCTSETTDLLTCADNAPAITIVRAVNRARDLLDIVACAGEQATSFLVELHGWNVNTAGNRCHQQQCKDGRADTLCDNACRDHPETVDPKLQIKQQAAYSRAALSFSKQRTSFY